MAIGQKMPPNFVGYHCLADPKGEKAGGEELRNQGLLQTHLCQAGPVFASLCWRSLGEEPLGILWSGSSPGTSKNPDRAASLHFLP